MCSRKKCRHRNISAPSFAGAEAHRNDLEVHWGYMLGHQLQNFTPLESCFRTLTGFFNWLETVTSSSYPAIDRTESGETVLWKSAVKLPIPHDTKVYLGVIRFSAINYLCVDPKYGQSVCRIEPYSLRRTQKGAILLYAIQISDGEHQAYQIHWASTTPQSFTPATWWSYVPVSDRLTLNQSEETFQNALYPVYHHCKAFHAPVN